MKIINATLVFFSVLLGVCLSGCGASTKSADDPAIAPVNTAPTAIELSITADRPTLTVGAKLTANYRFMDNDGDPEAGSVIEWWRRVGTDIAKIGAGKDFVLTFADTYAEAEVYFVVTPISAGVQGLAVTSATVATVNSAPQARGARALVNSSSDITQARVNDVLTGEFLFEDVDHNEPGNNLFAWYRSANATELGASPTLVANTQQYQIARADSGYYIYLEITPVAKSGVLRGTAVLSTPIYIANSAPVANNVTFSPDVVYAGAPLTASYIFSDADGDEQGASTYAWHYDGETNGTVLGTHKTYFARVADLNKSIAVTVTPRATTGVVSGQPVTSPPRVVQARPIGKYFITTKIPMNYYFVHDYPAAVPYPTKGWRINELGQITGSGLAIGAAASSYADTHHYFWSGSLTDITATKGSVSTAYGGGLDVLPNYSAIDDPNLAYFARPPAFGLIFGNLVAGYVQIPAQPSTYTNYIWSWQTGKFIQPRLAPLSVFYPNVTDSSVFMDVNAYNLMPPNGPVAARYYADLNNERIFNTANNAWDERGYVCKNPQSLGGPCTFNETLVGHAGNVGLDLNHGDEVAGFSYPTLNSPATRSWTYTGSRATKWSSEGKASDVGALPGDAYSAAFGLNDLGHVVGVSFKNAQSSTGERRAFVADANGIFDLSARAEDEARNTWLIEQAYSINNAGQIVASGRLTPFGPTNILILTPSDLMATALSIGIPAKTQPGDVQATVVTDPADPHVGELKVSFTLNVANASNHGAENIHVGGTFSHQLPLTPYAQGGYPAASGFIHSLEGVSMAGTNLSCNGRNSEDWLQLLGSLSPANVYFATFECVLPYLEALQNAELQVVYYIRIVYRSVPPPPGTQNVFPASMDYLLRATTSIDSPDLNLTDNAIDAYGQIAVK